MLVRNLRQRQVVKCAQLMMHVSTASGSTTKSEAVNSQFGSRGQFVFIVFIFLCLLYLLRYLVAIVQAKYSMLTDCSAELFSQ